MKKVYCFLLFTSHFLLSYSHEGHDHGPTPGQTGTGIVGPITLSDETIKNLGVESVEASLTPLQRSLNMVARIEPLPEKHAQISARFEGRILEILTKLGEKVIKDQPLLKLDPVTIGNPPVILRSPIDGFITRQNLTLGQSFTLETVLMEVSDHRQVLARGISYENSDLVELKVGQPARVKVDIFPNEIFTGTVQRTDIELEADSKTFEVYTLLENLELKLRPNMQATMSIGLGEAQEVLAVPKRAILGEIGNYFLFVQNGKTFEKRTIVLGIKAGDLVEILEGVFPNERVVVQGNYQLQYATSTSKNETTNLPTETKTKTSLALWILSGLIVLIVIIIVVRHIIKSRHV